MRKAAGARRGPGDGSAQKRVKRGGGRGELTEKVLKFEGAGLCSQTAKKEEKGVWYIFGKILNTCKILKFLQNLGHFCKLDSFVQFKPTNFNLNEK